MTFEHTHTSHIPHTPHMSHIRHESWGTRQLWSTGFPGTRAPSAKQLPTSHACISFVIIVIITPTGTANTSCEGCAPELRLRSGLQPWVPSVVNMWLRPCDSNVVSSCGCEVVKKEAVRRSRQHLLDVQRNRKPSLHRATALSCAGRRLRQPGVKPLIKLTGTSRCPHAVNNWEKIQRPLSQRSSITIKLGYHGDTSIQWTLTPNPNLLKPWSEPEQDHQTMGQEGLRLRSGPQLWVSNGVNMWLRPCDSHVVPSCGRSKIAQKEVSKKNASRHMVTRHGENKGCEFNSKTRHHRNDMVHIFFTKHERSCPSQFLLPANSGRRSVSSSFPPPSFLHRDEKRNSDTTLPPYAVSSFRPLLPVLC